MASTKLEALRHAFHKFEQKHEECLNLCPEEQYDQYCSSVVILQKAQLDYEKLMQHLKARAEIELNFMKSEQLRLEHQLRDLQLQDDLQSAMAKEEVLAAFEDTPTHQPNQVNVQSPVSCVLTAQLAVASAFGL